MNILEIKGDVGTLTGPHILWKLQKTNPLSNYNSSIAQLHNNFCMIKTGGAVTMTWLLEVHNVCL